MLVNTNRQNVQIQQPLLAAELFGTDQVKEIEHRADMEREEDNIQISFSPVAPDSIRLRSEQVEMVTPDIEPLTSSETLSFGPRPDVESQNFDSKAEIACLPFKLNMGTTVEMTHEQQSQFIISSMIIQRSSLCMMKTLAPAIKSSTLFQRLQTDPCICCTALFHHNH